MASYFVEGEATGPQGYRVRHPQQDTELSLRLVRGQLEPAMSQRLLRLRHPNLASVSDVFAEGGDTAVVSELLEGRSLAEWLVDRNRVPGFGVVCAIGADIARGLAAAHEAGLTHGHLSPNEVLLFTQGGDLRAKLVGVGLGDRVEPHEPGFRAPEYDAAPMSTGADLWSLGALLYCMITGAAPKGDADARTQQLKRADAQLPDSVTGVILALLDPEPSDRPSADAAAFELSTWVPDPVSTTPMADVRLDVPDDLPEVSLPSTTNDATKAMMMGVAGGVVLFGAAAVVLWWSLA